MVSIKISKLISWFIYEISVIKKLWLISWYFISKEKSDKIHRTTNKHETNIVTIIFYDCKPFKV
jgi:hypothetical protein